MIATASLRRLTVTSAVSDEMDFKEALKNSVKLLLGGIQNDKLVNMDKLKGDERVDLVNTVSLIMP